VRFPDKGVAMILHSCSIARTKMVGEYTELLLVLETDLQK